MKDSRPASNAEPANVSSPGDQPWYAWPDWMKFTCLAVCAPILFLWSLGYVDRFTPPFPYSDFAQEWTSARSYLAGESVYPNLTEATEKFIGEPVEFVMDYNAHPPASILLFIPLGSLTYDQAFATWNWLSLGMLVVATVLMIRQPGVMYSPWAILPIAVFMATSNSLIQQFNQGQLNTLLLLLIAGAWVVERRGWSLFAGLLIGLAAAVKLFPAFLMLYFLVQRRWWGLLGGAIGFLVPNLAAVALFGVDAYITYLQEILPSLSLFRDFLPNVSIGGFWAKLLVAESQQTEPIFQAPWLAKLLTALCSLAVVALTAWVTWRCRTRRHRDTALMLCLLAMMLVSPITWDHYFVIFFLPVVVLWRTLPAGVGYRVALLSAAILLMTVYLAWVWGVFLPGGSTLIGKSGGYDYAMSPLQTMTVISYQFYILLGSFVALTVVLFGQTQLRSNEIPSLPANA